MSSPFILNLSVNAPNRLDTVMFTGVVVFHQFDVFEILIQPIDKRLAPSVFPWSSLF